MRIALLTTSWPASPGDPSGHFVLAEARALEHAGHQVVVIAPRAGGAFGWPGVGARLREHPLRALEGLGWVARAGYRLRGMRVDRVVAHWAVPCAWPVAVAAPGASLDVVSHGGDVRLLLALPFVVRRTIAAAIAGRAQRWRFVSSALLSAFLGGLDRPLQDRVERVAAVVPAALDVPDVRAAVTALRQSLGDQRVAVSVGRLVATKRVDRAIEYAARARELDALVVVGDGPERARLERLARRHGAPNGERGKIRFVGAVPREEALAWIGAADVVLHASEAEGLSTVVREAEALGTPVKTVGDGGPRVGRSR
jgi:teichuronic acid biosynthesis glycosyltransferase TuaC